MDDKDGREVFRPWGSYDSIDIGGRYQVKRIAVKPGAKLSVQMHHHRAEHWVLVSGTARVTNGEKSFLVTENQSTYIPVGQVHALENPGTIPLELIEVQSGSYLFEDGSLSLLDRLWENIRNQAVTLRVPNCSELRSGIDKTMQRALLPWQKAEEAASLARKTWSLNNGPLSTSRLAEMFQISQEFILDGDDYPVLPLHVGFRNGGGHQEFLCPFMALRDYLGGGRPYHDPANHYCRGFRQ
jgi:mannose-6-phosphate isomerase-like protein (cupin superfamily)